MPRGRQGLEEDIKRLKGVLAFYADQKNWVTPSEGFCAQYDPEDSAIEKDHGTRARIALGFVKQRSRLRKGTRKGAL
jgi:hypothetical protein